jgi:Glyoxalase-like domain
MQGAQDPAVAIDHVILGVDNLERGIRQFQELTGVTPKRGGEHPGRGTQNALVTLGGGHYLEILAPAESAARDAPRDPRVDHAGLTLASWALQTRSIGSVVTRLRAAGFTVDGPIPGSRRALDGTLLQWQTAAASGAGLELAPFFIEWSKETTHPSVSSPGGCTLAQMEISHPQPARLRAVFSAVSFQTVVSEGKRPGMRLTLDCPRGRVTFSN